MNELFPNVQKNFGFGYMRLPMIGDDVDIPQTCKMVDAFLENGFNYFDTAHGYIDGKSELAIKECLSSRYPRDQYILTNKLSPNFFEKQEDFENALIALYENEIIPAVGTGLCGAVYTQVSDVEDETNGLLSYDRKICKVNPNRMTKISQALAEAMQETEN